METSFGFPRVISISFHLAKSEDITSHRGLYHTTLAVWYLGLYSITAPWGDMVVCRGTQSCHAAALWLNQGQITVLPRFYTIFYISHRKQSRKYILPLHSICSSLGTKSGCSGSRFVGECPGYCPYGVRRSPTAAPKERRPSLPPFTHVWHEILVCCPGSGLPVRTRKDIRKS